MSMAVTVVDVAPFTVVLVNLRRKASCLCSGAVRADRKYYERNPLGDSSVCARKKFHLLVVSQANRTRIVKLSNNFLILREPIPVFVFDF